MILELHILVKNIHTYMYACANFQEHLELDTEDTRTRVIIKLSIFPVFLLI